MRQSAETVPSAYATLVMFLYDLAHGDDAGARALVTDAALVNTARSLGLDGWKGKYWLLACPNTGGSGCGWDSGPVSFYQGPPVAISFVEQDGQWLISDITKRP